jgi:hypothetical protein
VELIVDAPAQRIHIWWSLQSGFQVTGIAVREEIGDEEGFSLGDQS